MKGTLPVRVRFGAFEFDLRTGELRAGMTERRIVLADQPFGLLAMLVEREGAMLAREEIRKNFWTHDTIIEFDHNSTPQKEFSFH
jgi:eukaryotic-like serine/threonine-protein kinase